MIFFACRKFFISWQIDGGCARYTVRAHIFFSCAFCQRACPSLLSQLCRWIQPHSRALTPHTSSRNVSRHTSLDHTEHAHSLLIFDVIFLTCLSSTSQRAWTPRRSTIQVEWRFGWAPILHRLWAQAACWTPGSQAFHRKTSSLPNTRIYVSNPCSSTNRAQRRPTILLRA